MKRKKKCDQSLWNQKTEHSFQKAVFTPLKFNKLIIDVNVNMNINVDDHLTLKVIFSCSSPFFGKESECCVWRYIGWLSHTLEVPSVLFALKGTEITLLVSTIWRLKELSLSSRRSRWKTISAWRTTFIPKKIMIDFSKREIKLKKNMYKSTFAWYLFIKKSEGWINIVSLLICIASLSNKRMKMGDMFIFGWISCVYTCPIDGVVWLIVAHTPWSVWKSPKHRHYLSVTTIQLCQFCEVLL